MITPDGLIAPHDVSIHVPAGEQVNVVEPVAHTANGPEIGEGEVATVTIVVTVQPVPTV